MVFPGRLSTGCHICRTRKVKCDGAKPECRRCAQHGVKCTGYPDRFSFREYKPPKQSKVGKSASSESRSRTASPRPGSKGASPSTSENSMRDSRFEVVLAAQSPSNAPSICSDWQSVCNLMHQLVLPVHRSPCGGYLAFLPQLFQEKGESPSLRYAILGVSYLTLSKSHSGGELQIKARKNYGACLNSLNQEISSQDNAIRDETLAACLLLSMFFNLAHEGEGLPDPHMAGVSYLLSLRGHHQLKSQYFRSLIGWTIIQTQIQAIGTGKFQYAKLPEIIKTKSRPCNVFGAGILNSLISEYLQASSVLLNASAVSDPIIDQMRSESIQSMLIRAFDLITKIDIWENSIPPHWRKQYHNENIPGAVSTLTDPWTTTFLAVTHSAQILFYQNVIALCDEMIMREPAMETHIQLRKTAADRINAPLEVVCFAVASSIGELDTNGQFHARPTAQFGNNNTLVWPMWLALTCPFSTPHQKALCQRGLDYIGNTLGHKLASSLHQQACTVPMISTSIPIQPP